MGYFHHFYHIPQGRITLYMLSSFFDTLNYQLVLISPARTVVFSRMVVGFTNFQIK